MDYTEAVAQAESGKALLVSNAGGRTRYVKFAMRESVVEATLFSTVIAEFHPNFIVVRTGGYNTRITREALSVLLPGHVYSHERVAYWRGEGREATPLTEGMVLGYDGSVERHGEPTPRSPGRRMKHGYAVNIIFGVEPDTGQIVSKRGGLYAWPVLDFAGMTPANGWQANYDLQVLTDREVGGEYVEAVRAPEVPVEVRTNHREFWAAYDAQQAASA